MNYPSDIKEPSLVSRMYNGLNRRSEWPVIVLTKPIGFAPLTPPKSWWRRLLGF